MIFAVICFAIMNVLAKSLHHIPVHELIFFRSIVSLSFCFYFVKKYHLYFWGNNKFWLTMRGLMGLIALYLFFSTIKNMPLATASIIQYLSPVFTILIATLLNGQKVKGVQWIYFTIAFIGVILIKGLDTRVSLEWLGVGVLSALFSGLAYNAIIKSKGTDHPIIVVMYFPLIALPFAGIACLFQWVQPDGWDWIKLLAMGAVTQGGQYYTTLALHGEDASKVTPWNYLGAIFAVGLGWLFFGEAIEPLSFVGMMLVIVGVVLNARVKALPLVTEK